MLTFGAVEVDGELAFALLFDFEYSSGIEADVDVVFSEGIVLGGESDEAVQGDVHVGQFVQSDVKEVGIDAADHCLV